MTRHEDLLSAALHNRADGVEAQRTSMADVISTARGIRRRRRAVVVLAAAAAVAAVAVPTAILVGRDPAAGPAPGTNSPTPTPTQSPSGAALADLPTGAPPAIGYVEDHVYISTEGSRFNLPTDRGISAITPYHGGFLVADTRTFEGSVGLALVDGAGTRTEEWCSSGAPVVSADRLDTAWVTFPCPESDQTGGRLVHRGISTGMGEGETTQTVGDRAPITVAGILGQDVVVDGAWEEQAYLTDLSSAPRPIADLSSVDSVDEVGGLVAGQLGQDGQDAAVLDPRTGTRSWQAAHLYLGQFSPDGSLIAGQGRDGWSLYDRSGEVVSDLALPEGSNVSGMAWEDDRHLVAVVTTDRQVAIVRFDVHGAAELATPVVRYDPNDPAYVLGVQP